MPTMKLPDYARSIGLHPKTVYAWYRNGTLPHPARQMTARTILVDVPDDEHVPTMTRPEQQHKLDGVGLYARVSSADQKQDLIRQAERLRLWAEMQGWHVVREESEIGSGMNGKRRKVLRLLADPKVSTIVVEHKDRLGRMNVELVEASLAANNRRLIVLDTEELQDDLVSDMVGVLTSFCARLYGKRSARNRAVRALKCAEQSPTSEIPHQQDKSDTLATEVMFYA